jgi:hypothetical protein
MERYKNEIMYEVAKETLRYAANKIAMEYQMDGKPLPSTDELVRLAVERVKVGAVNGEVM